MPSSFLTHLAAGSVLVADGATGTNLQAAGLPAGVSAESLVFDEPEKILALHRAFIAAGSDIILTCSFRGNRLCLHGSKLAGSVPALNRQAAVLARRAADEAGGHVFVAGSMGPTGQLMAPYGPLAHADAVSVYAEQAAALAEGGVEFLVLETFYALEEAQAAIEGVQQAAPLPLVCSFSYDRGVRTMMGVGPAQMAEAIAPLGVVALGANCGTTPENMEAVILELAGHSGGLPIWAKPNAGVPEGTPPRYKIGPDAMAAWARRYRTAGAQIVGGCCGNTPAHIRAIAEAVKLENSY